MSDKGYVSIPNFKEEQFLFALFWKDAEKSPEHPLYMYSNDVTLPNNIKNPEFFSKERMDDFLKQFVEKIVDPAYAEFLKSKGY